MESLTRLQLADLFAGGYAFPHEVVDDDRFASSREVRARYRGIGIIRHEVRDEPRSTYWVPMGVSTSVLNDTLPTEILPEDFMPVTDLLSIVETIRSLDAAIDWVLGDKPLDVAPAPPALRAADGAARGEVLNFRVTTVERARLTEAAERSSSSMSDFLRRRVLGE